MGLMLVHIYNSLAVFRYLEICAMSIQNKSISCLLYIALYTNRPVVDMNQSQYFR